MAFLSSLNIPLSGMTAQRFRMELIQHNITNEDNVASTPEDVYKRQMVVFREDRTFKKILAQRMASGEYIPKIYDYVELRGVVAAEVVKDETPAEPVYSPDHPLADENGYIYESNVNLLVEENDMIAASNSYNACKSAYEALQSIIQSTLSIGS